MTDFNRWAPRYDRHWLQRRLFSPVHVAVLEEAAESAPGAVLDVGCGTGRLLEQARRRWPQAELTGVDAAPAMIEVAGQRFAGDPRVRLLVGVAERLPLPDASFDVALSTVSSHHWDDLAAGLLEVARVLRPGGRMVLADVHRGGLWGPVMTVSGILRGERMYRRPAIAEMFEAAGLALRDQRVLPGVGGSLLLTSGQRAG